MSETKTETNAKTKLILPVAIIAAIVVAAVVLVLILPKGSSDGQITTVTSKLEKILEISDLETAQIFYNAVATKMNETDENVLYYAAYEGMIKAGIDFSKVEFVPDKETKTISVIIPNAEVLEYSVNPGTIEYIFIDKKAETESVAQEAYRLCLADLEKRSVEDSDQLLEAAYENGKKALEGLFKPWMEQGQTEYTLIIK